MEAGALISRLDNPRTAARVALVATLVALALRVAVALVFGERVFWSDERMYAAHARHVVEGQWMGPTTFIPPGHYYLLALVYLVFPATLLTARLYQAVVSAASVWLAYRLVRRVSPGAGALCACVMAVYPLVAYTAGTLYPQTVDLFFLLLSMNLLSDHVERPSWKRLTGSGLCLGASALIVPTVLTVCPFLGAWLWWARGRTWRGALEVLALAACVVLAMTPWIVRNFKVEHRFVPVATVGSQFFFFANNPNADPDSKDLSLLDKVYTDEIKAEIRSTGNEDAVYARHAWDFIRTQPGQFATFYFKRLRNFFAFTPKTFTHNEDRVPAGKWVLGLASAPVLLLALFGAWPLARRSRVAALWVILPLAWGLASAIFGVTLRYRVPVEPYILAVCAVTLWGLLGGKLADRA